MEPQDVEEEVPPKEMSVEKYWETSVDLSHVDNENLRDRIFCFSRKYFDSWSGYLGEVAAIEHRI